MELSRTENVSLELQILAIDSQYEGSVPIDDQAIRIPGHSVCKAIIRGTACPQQRCQRAQERLEPHHRIDDIPHACYTKAERCK